MGETTRYMIRYENYSEYKTILNILESIDGNIFREYKRRKAISIDVNSDSISALNDYNPRRPSNIRKPNTQPLTVD